VREGFRHATGAIILIQDADLEYSVDDYAKLIEPIMRGEVDFTLGSRHAPGRSVRVMDGTRMVAPIMNTAHWVFTWFFNVTYGTKLRDPFTMYKVFRSECIDGVEFVADRFDFDWELVAKLVRLGYKPIEVPVEYKARSFSGGKKVRFFRDPPTWIVACLRFRFCSLPAQRRDPRSGANRTRRDLLPERPSDAFDA
jgi:glycosyltransferase involved in cell wall biosynthesis